MSRVLVCGSRTHDDAWAIREVLEGLADEVTCVIVGGCRGPDFVAARWADGRGIPYSAFKADWKLYGLSAGPVRNREMVEVGRPTLCLAFWDGKSKGTLNTITECVKAGVPVRIVPVANAAQVANATSATGHQSPDDGPTENNEVPS